ncbi:MAG: hypothetical protein QOG72_1254 [Sphingomonadales bacterium]|jgi:hypothetical protein|nr:hypothetical protein [Sphingomonadales bacterium]
MRKSLIAIAASAALLAPAGSASAKVDPATWVQHILLEMDAIQKGNGYRPEGEMRPGALASGGVARLEFALAGGTAYRFVVVCESACGAGEVMLLDPAGTAIAGPGVLVEMPKLDAAPAAAGNYTLRVAMTDCASESCAWSARLYARR